MGGSNLEILTMLKERLHSEMKISDKIKLDPNIMPFAFFFSKSVSIPSDIQFRPQNITSRTCIITSRDLHYHFQGPALSLPGTCIIASKALHFHFRDLPALSLPGTCIITS